MAAYSQKIETERFQSVVTVDEIKLWCHRASAILIIVVEQFHKIGDGGGVLRLGGKVGHVIDVINVDWNNGYVHSFFAVTTAHSCQCV